jgi:hypothetical protein
LSPLAATGVLLFVFRVIRAHLKSKGLVSFQKFAELRLSLYVVYQADPDGRVVHGTPGVPVRPNIFSWHSSVSMYLLVGAEFQGSTSSPFFGLMM